MPKMPKRRLYKKSPEPPQYTEDELAQQVIDAYSNSPDILEWSSTNLVDFVDENYEKQVYESVSIKPQTGSWLLSSYFVAFAYTPLRNGIPTPGPVYSNCEIKVRGKIKQYRDIEKIEAAIKESVEESLMADSVTQNIQLSGLSVTFYSLLSQRTMSNQQIASINLDLDLVDSEP